MRQTTSKRPLRLRTFDPVEIEEYRKRFERVTFFIIVVFAVIFARLWYLQIIKGNEYLKRSEKNCIRTQFVAAPRGDIFDRNGQILVRSRPSFSISIVREDVKDINSLLNRLSPLLKEETASLQAKIRAAQDLPRHMPIRLREDADLDTVALIETFRFELPGVVINVEPKRAYVYGNMASHLFGYLGEVNERELKRDTYKNVRMGELVGRCGLEKIYQGDLGGISGGRQVEVDAAGRVIRVYGEIPPVLGNSLYLTLDGDLQRVAEDCMAGQSGAVVAMDPRSGRILVWASCPNIDLESFIRGLKSTEWQALVNDPLRPLPDKVIQGQYPPGSTYKIVTMAAALEEKVIDPLSSLYCSGYYGFGNRVYRCWEKKGHGSVNMHKGIVRSCDVYFYEMGRRLGVDRLARYGRGLGLGQLTHVELEHEKAGLAPTREWKLKRYKVPWQDGETLSVAIGQGFNLVTPLQMARVISAVANGGILYHPQFIEKIVDRSGKTVKQLKPVIDGRVPVSKENLTIVRDGLVGVVNEGGGTGGRCRLTNITVGGKTGTAQIIKMGQARVKSEDLPYKYRDHAWFVAFAPAESPEIAIAVLIEHGGHGGSAAGPVARAVFEEYFSRKAETAAEPALTEKAEVNEKRGPEATVHQPLAPPAGRPGEANRGPGLKTTDRDTRENAE
ncbi:MAG: penicillin-binding protein 2 [Pseudomonadota bacterium]